MQGTAQGVSGEAGRVGWAGWAAVGDRRGVGSRGHDFLVSSVILDAYINVNVNIAIYTRASLYLRFRHLVLGVPDHLHLGLSLSICLVSHDVKYSERGDDCFSILT